MNLEILKLRKKIYKNLKAKAYSFESENLELDKYLKNQIRYSKQPFSEVSIEDLATRVSQSRITYLGDFHTFDQNIRNVLRIIRYILTQNENVILALEMISSEHQFYVDAYTEGHLTDLEFLDCINYHDSWRFPWTHYKLIFEIVKKNKIKVLALNTKGTLTERDKFAAKKLTEAANETPHSKLLVFYGELHISKNKIPDLVTKLIPNINSTIIHQNLDEVYWKLLKNNIEEGIVKFSDSEYCIISAPPWIKYESMIYWYENLSDDPDFDIHEYIIENGAKTFTGDTEENFLNICNELTFYLNLSTDEIELDDFNLYDHTNLTFIEEKLEEKTKGQILKFYQEMISKNKSFKLPYSNKYYCSSYSMNRISYLAGIHIFQLFLQKNNFKTMDILQSKSSIKKFLLFFYECMFAFFFSKIINPHRKCSMYGDIKKEEENFLRNSILDIIDGKSLSEKLKGIKLTDLYFIAESVGHIFGEYLYELAKKNPHSINLELNLFKTKLSKEEFVSLRNMLFVDDSYKSRFKRYF